MAKPHQLCFLCQAQGLFLGAVLLCLDLSAPMCFLLSRSGAAASPCFPLVGVSSSPDHRLSPTDIPCLMWGKSSAGERLIWREQCGTPQPRGQNAGALGLVCGQPSSFWASRMLVLLCLLCKRLFLEGNA